MRSTSFVFLAVVALTACADTGVVQVSVPLEVAGGDHSVVERDDGWRIELSRADVAFGPLYLCSGPMAGDLCDTARAEWAGSVMFDALDPSPRRAGTLEGTSGLVLSWMYDHGITSLLTKQGATVLDAAEQLDGNSVVVEGSAESGGTTLTFSARIPIQQEEETEIGVPVVRKSTSDVFDHDIIGDETSLLIRFDPSLWLSDIDFSSLASDGDQTLSFQPNDQAYRAIRNALVAGERPAFQWQVK